MDAVSKIKALFGAQKCQNLQERNIHKPQK